MSPVRQEKTPDQTHWSDQLSVTKSLGVSRTAGVQNSPVTPRLHRCGARSPGDGHQASPAPLRAAGASVFSPYSTPGLEGTACEERMGTPRSSGSEKRRLRGDLVALYAFLKNSGCGEGGAHLFSPAPCVRMHGNRTRQKGSDWAIGRGHLYRDGG